jgi:hypothetical protein
VYYTTSTISQGKNFDTPVPQSARNQIQEKARR